MSNTLPALFNCQFFDKITGAPLAGGLVHTYISGTTTNQLTYQDPTTVSPNANPIVLDSAGMCNLWLIPADVYTILWTRADGSQGVSRDNVSGTLPSSTGVTSVNGFTGVVAVTADDIPYATGVVAPWFSATDSGAAFDQIISRVTSPAASTVSVADAGGYYTGTNVEDVLQEVGADLAALGTTPGGRWTPTLTNTLNVSSSSAFLGQYLKVGKFVTASVVISVTPTAGAAAPTQVDFTLPVASTFVNQTDCVGAANSAASAGATGGAISAGSPLTKARLSFLSNTTSATAMYCHFTYAVLP